MKPILIPQLLMGVFAVLCLVVLLTGIKSAVRKTDWSVLQQKSFLKKAVLLTVAWIILLSVLSIAGLTKITAMPPRPVLLMIVGTALLFYLSFTRSFTALLAVVPPYWLVYLQSFRIGVEILLWLAFTQHLLPVQMTWEGLNYDVLSGLLALPAGWLMKRYPHKQKTIGVLYNVIGIALLFNILTVAILSMPVIAYFTNEPAPYIVGEFPFIFLPGVLVVLANALHIFSLRQLLSKKIYSAKSDPLVSYTTGPSTTV